MLEDQNILSFYLFPIPTYSSPKLSPSGFYFGVCFPILQISFHELGVGMCNWLRAEF